jgi:hypothetical protein
MPMMIVILMKTIIAMALRVEFDVDQKKRLRIKSNKIEFDISESMTHTQSQKPWMVFEDLPQYLKSFLFYGELKIILICS